MVILLLLIDLVLIGILLMVEETTEVGLRRWRWK